jgi:hypothetical protein
MQNDDGIWMFDVARTIETDFMIKPHLTAIERLFALSRLKFADQAVSVRQNLPGIKIDDCLFCAQNPCLGSDVDASISLTSIDEIKCLSSIAICLRFIILNHHLQNIKFHQGQVIHATKYRPMGRSRHAGLVPHISPLLQ